MFKKIILCSLFGLLLLLSQSAHAIIYHWDVSDDGNGHYYELMYEKLYWSEAKTKAESLGGYLTTITTQEESEWINTTFYSQLAYETTFALGGYQDRFASDYSEPAGGWRCCF